MSETGFHRWTTEDGEIAEIRLEPDGEYSWSFPPGSVAAVLVREVMRQKGRADAALERAAQKVEAAGCICWCLEDSDDGSQALFTTEYDSTGDREVAVHDPRCPFALAAAIREGR